MQYLSVFKENHLGIRCSLKKSTLQDQSLHGNLNFENAKCAKSDVPWNKTPQIFNGRSVDYVFQNSDSKFANIEVCETSL